MALPNNEVIKVIEESKVSPPPGAVPTTSLPLTFFDVPMLLFCPDMQRLYFYEFPHPIHHILESLLPLLKHSLSLTLQHFFPFSANLVCPPPPENPHILFTTGRDSVSLTVAESTADFEFLSTHHPRGVHTLHPFVPKFAPTRVEAGNTSLSPLLALQVTVFPNSGICIGVRASHTPADSRSLDHFMRSWALACKMGGDLAWLGRELGFPSHDRAAIKDPDGLLFKLLSTGSRLGLSASIGQHTGPSNDGLNDKVRAAFVLSQAQIERLKRWVNTNDPFANDDKKPSTPFHISSFAVTCALTWVCLAKSEEVLIEDEDDDEPYYFQFAADCRGRLEFPLPTTYFGNCLTGCYAKMNRKELLGENGIARAAKAIGKEVEGLKSEALKDAEHWIEKRNEVTERCRHVDVVGSPKFGAYEADFGWGRPKKIEWVHFENSTAFSLVENREEKGGMEVGLVQGKDRMNRFSGIWEEILLKLG